jgi:hypothetical protein
MVLWKAVQKIRGLELRMLYLTDDMVVVPLVQTW